MTSAFKSLTVNDTGSLTLASGTTAQRPSNSSTLVTSFTSVGTTTWACPANVTAVEVLVVAGGGGGGTGNGRSGGGGGGGVIYQTNYPVVPGISYTVTVGAGGSGSTNASAVPNYAGGNSVFDKLTALGGGGGGNGTGTSSNTTHTIGQDGGSGGGGGGTNNITYSSAGGKGTQGQGYGGGLGVHMYGIWAGGGGGGGAGGPGTLATNYTRAHGGPGFLCNITGTPTYYGGGGGGCYFSGTGLEGYGGVGGGGASNNAGNGVSGATNTGGGGGASGTATGGSGGSGIVILRYTLASDNSNPVGQTRYNTDKNTIETYGTNSQWKPTLTDTYRVSGGLISDLDPIKYVSGNTWYDQTRSGNNGTLVGSPTFSSTYFSLNGTSQYVDLGTASTFGSSDISFAFWVYPTTYNASAAGQNQRVIHYWDGTNEMQLILNESNNFIWGSAPQSTGIGTTERPALNKWSYVVVTKRSGAFEAIYIDGGKSPTTSITPGAPSRNTTKLLFGANVDGNNGFFTGRFGGIKIFKRALSLGEVKALYNEEYARQNKAPSYVQEYAPIVNEGLILHLDAGNPASYPAGGTIWSDLTKYGNVGSMSGYGVPYHSDYGGYLQFDGSSHTVAMNQYINSYPFSFAMWVTHDNSWNPGSGQMDELVNLSIGGQRVSLGISDNSGSGWPKGPGIFYGGTSHYSLTTPFSTTGPTDWHHIVFVVQASNDSANHACYIDGVFYPMTNNGGGHGGSAGMNIGSNSASGEYWQGKIAQVLGYNRVLLPHEVQQIYHATKGRFGKTS